VRGACLDVGIGDVKVGGVETGRVRTGARRVLPDERGPDTQDPGASRPDQVLLLSVIAGMAHSTLKSGAATRNGVAFGASTEGPAATGAGPFGQRTKVKS